MHIVKVITNEARCGGDGWEDKVFVQKKQQNTEDCDDRVIKTSPYSCNNQGKDIIILAWTKTKSFVVQMFSPKAETSFINNNS